MSCGDDVIYLYDGTFEGMLCCVFTAFSEHENPCAILPFDEEQPTLYRQREVAASPEQAARVHDSVARRLGPLAEQWLLDAYYSALPQKEMAVLEFLKLGFAKGPCALKMLGHPQVAPLFTASRALHNEAHLLKGFLRFSDRGGVLIGLIEPKNFVLPYLAPHFCSRFPRESFLIYDKTHRYALVSSHGEHRLLPIDRLQLPPASADEARYQALWKRFYDTVEIEARHNPRGRMTHLPKRYWQCMTELEQEKTPLPVSVRQALEKGELTLPSAPAALPEKNLSQAPARRPG